MTQIAVLDANILYSVAAADPLIYAAEYHAFVPVWSERIEQEYTASLIANGKNPASVERRRFNMNAALPASRLTLAAMQSFMDEARIICAQAKHHDPDDAHVIAAALASGATVLVTANRRDFPTRFHHGGLTTVVMGQNDFLNLLLDERPDAVVHGMHRYHDDLVRHPRTYAEMLAIMRAKGGYTSAVDRLAVLLRNPPMGSAPVRPGGSP